MEDQPQTNPQPAVPTARKHRMQLVAFPENRGEDTTKDSRLVNGYIERSQRGQFYVYKRPGVSVYASYSGAGMGMYNWNGDIYSIFGGTLRRNSTTVGSVDTTGGVYAFSSCLGTTPKLFLMNGVKAYVYDPVGGLVTVTDVDYPAALVRGAVYLDGYTSVMDPSATIYSSGLNDPTAWDPLDFLKAQIEPDRGVALAKQLVYIIALKEWTCEVFYDAANGEGSPFGPVQGSKVNVGCRAAGSVRDLDGMLIWVSQTRNSSVAVHAMDGMRASPISTPAVERLLQRANFATTWAWSARIGGHRFYAVTLKNSNLTLVYDFTSKLWSQWTDTNGNYLPYVDATNTPNQQILLQHETDGKIYEMDLGQVSDNGSPITLDLYTPIFDGGSRTRKVVIRLDVVADQQSGSILQIRRSDDDFQTWSAFRNVDLSQSRPNYLHDGTFRKRVYHARHSSNTPLRLHSFDLDALLGEE